MVMAWLAFGCSHPAFPAETPTETPAGNPAQLSQLQFAPVQIRPSLGGSIDYMWRRDTLGAAKSSSQALTVGVNVGADVRTFIWQPWFAQVSGGLGIATYMTDTGYNSGNSSSSNKTVTRGVTGNVALDIVPISRFPFNAHYEKGDNRQNIGVGTANSASQTTSYGLSQHYRTLSGQSNYLATYTRGRSERERSGVDERRQVSISMGSTLSPNQNLSISGNSNFSEHLGSNQSILSDTVVVNHSYRPAAAVTVETLANLSRTNYRLTQGTNEDKYTQLSSFTSWTSDERPLTVTGSARLAGLSNSTPTGTVQQNSASASLGTGYQFTRQFRTNASASVNLADDKNSGTQNMSSGESVGASYNSDQTNLGNFRYGTNAGGSLSNSNTSTGSSQSIGLSAGHGLSRSSIESGRVRLDTNVNQSVSASKATSNPTTTSLSHAGSLGWTIAGEGGITGVRLSASDSRTMSTPQGFFQLINLQANRSESMSRNTSLSGTLTIQKTRQGTDSAPATSATTSSASLSYAQQRVFGVPRLNLSSDVRIYSDSLVPLTAGPLGQASRSWGNRLGYSIGRLQLSLDANVAQTNHINSSLLMFRLSRIF